MKFGQAAKASPHAKFYILSTGYMYAYVMYHLVHLPMSNCMWGPVGAEMLSPCGLPIWGPLDFVRGIKLGPKSQDNPLI